MICIDDQQRTLHVVSEAVAVVMIAPLLGWVAARRELPTPIRAAAGAGAAGTLLIDGYLLMRFLRRDSERASG